MTEIGNQSQSHRFCAFCQKSINQSWWDNHLNTKIHKNKVISSLAVTQLPSPNLASTNTHSVNTPINSTSTNLPSSSTATPSSTAAPTNTNEDQTASSTAALTTIDFNFPNNYNIDLDNNFENGTSLKYSKYGVYKTINTIGFKPTLIKINDIKKNIQILYRRSSSI